MRGKDTTLGRVTDHFNRQFGGVPLLVRSPGRINIIGEHTDYNSGFVLPAAIDRSLVFGMRRTDTRRGRFYALDKEEGYETTLSDVMTRSRMEWANYLMGVITVMQGRGTTFSGVDVVFSGDIPIGAGLSSSAALTAGMAFGLNDLFELELDRESLARIAQKAENDFVGINCGVMDSFVNLHASGGYALKLDCRSLEYEQIPLGGREVCFLLCDSGVQRELTTSEYNKRRQQCEEGVSFLQARGEQIQALRDVDHAILEKYREEMDPLIFRRMRYVVEENGRVLAACDDLRSGDMEALGRRMTESHRGQRDLYEVSCEEIDFLADRAGACDGVLGSRLTGGGFGGCTLNLVRQASVDEFTDCIRRAYSDRYDRELRVCTVNSSAGTRVLG